MTTSPKAEYEALSPEEIAEAKRLADQHDDAAGAGDDFASPECRLIARALRIAAAQEGQEAGWLPIDTAPKDGTRILIWFVHPNAEYSADPVGEGWAGPHEARWLDHNGGGWTWYGLAGKATFWQPMPAPPASAIRALKKERG